MNFCIINGKLQTKETKIHAMYVTFFRTTEEKTWWMGTESNVLIKNLEFKIC